MDTRAWRLPLPSDVRWVEVDQQRVLDAKLALLADAGAQVTHQADSSGCEHRLQCGTYHAVGALRRAALSAQAAPLARC